jgi:hypothetical protein
MKPTCEPIHRVSTSYLSLTPSQKYPDDVPVARQLSDPMDECQRGFEIGKFVGAGQMVLVHYRPVRELAMQFREFCPLSAGTPPRQET